MRISDWSSDVCSSDLLVSVPHCFLQTPDWQLPFFTDCVCVIWSFHRPVVTKAITDPTWPARERIRTLNKSTRITGCASTYNNLIGIAKSCLAIPVCLNNSYVIVSLLFPRDRKIVVLGKSVSFRVDPGGRRIIKKKNIKIMYNV